MIRVFGHHAGNNGVSMYRIWQPLKYLDRNEFQVKRVPDRSERVHWDGLTGPCNVPTLGSHADIIEGNDIIFSNFRANEEDCARLTITSKLKKLVIDLDDDILHMPTDNQNYKHWFSKENGMDYWGEIPEDEESDPKWEQMAKQKGCQLLRHPKTGRLCLVTVKRHPWEMVLSELKAAQLVTVSTQRLKEVYGKYNPNTVVIPNSIDFDNYPSIVQSKTDNLIRLGLFGSNSHFRDWKTIAKVLRTILDEFPNVRLCFNTWYRAKGAPGSSMDEQEMTLLFPDYFDGFREHPQCEVFAGVEIEMYHEWLADKRVDIGLAPLCDSEFNRAKSNIKYLEFSALRIPGVYQDMEPYNTDVKGGWNGMLAGDSASWLKCLRRLITNAPLRMTMGERAYQDVRARYDQAQTSRLLASEFKKLMGLEAEEIQDLSRTPLVLAR